MTVPAYLLLVAVIFITAASCLGLIELIDRCFEQSGPAQEKPDALTAAGDSSPCLSVAVTGEASTTVYNWEAEGAA